MIRRPASPDILVGKSSAIQLLSENLNSSSFLIIDDALEDRILLEKGITGLAVSSQTTLEEAKKLSERLRSEAFTEVFVAGGGNTIDLATLGVAMACDLSLYDFLNHRVKHSGFLMAPVPSRASLPLILVPSTVGPGAQCSMSACFQWEEAGERYKSLVAVPHVRARAVAYDPIFLHGPDTLVREGVFEVLVRVLSAAAETPSTFPLADSEAFYLLKLLAGPIQKLSEGSELTDEEIISCITVSGESHAGWALRGRGIAPSSLWFLANELSMVGGLRKNQAMRLLLEPWLAELADPQGPWGRAEVVRNLCLEVSLGQWSGSQCGQWLEKIFPLPQKIFVNPDQVVERVLKRFGGGRPMNRSINKLLLDKVFKEALRFCPSAVA